MKREQTEAKKQIWEIASEETIAKGREDFNQKMQKNLEIATKLRTRSEFFKPKPNTPPTLPTMQEFLMIAHLHKLDHGESMQLFQYLMEQLIELDKNLAMALQYLEDNMQSIAKKTDTQLSAMGKEVAEVKQVIKEPIYGLIKEKNEMEKKWKKMAEGNRGVVV